MAVPTIYSKLLQTHQSTFKTECEREEAKAILRRDIRLMVSGSAALPQVVIKRYSLN